MITLCIIINFVLVCGIIAHLHSEKDARKDREDKFYRSYTRWVNQKDCYLDMVEDHNLQIELLQRHVRLQDELMQANVKIAKHIRSNLTFYNLKKR